MKPFLIKLAGMMWVAGVALSAPLPVVAAGDADAGARVYGVCAACHSLEPGRHMTGPSLAEVWGRGAGSVDGFGRYSGAMREAEIVWDEQTLNAFLADPQALIPGNRMQFGGIGDAETRADLVAFLEEATQERGEPSDDEPDAGSGGMMGSLDPKNLKALGPEQRIASIRYCGDTYRVTTEAERTFPFWEFNLRFKTDSGEYGPHAGQPVIIRAGMRGDRAFVVFADPAEIGRFIKHQCD